MRNTLILVACLLLPPPFSLQAADVSKMKPVPSTLLTREHYEQRAAKVRAAGAQGLHLFNETRKQMFQGLAD